MTPSAFEYVRARSVEDAIAHLSGSDDARVLAGGHSLLPAMKLRLDDPSLLVDISGIGSLQQIEHFDNCIAVGALVTHRSVEVSEIVCAHCAPLAQAAGGIGDPQVRNRGTIGGSLAHADPAADYPALVLALDATVTVCGPWGKRKIAANAFFLGLFETALKSGEIITRVCFPVLGPSEGAAYAKFANPASKYAVVGVAAWVAINADGTCRDIRVGVTGASLRAHRADSVEAALRGGTLDAAMIQSATAGFARPDALLSDLGGSPEYRSHLCSVMARRAITEAAAQASS